MLTDEEVATLSPAAAAASRLIKSGQSLTNIYRDHCKVVEELELQRIENKRLEQYFQELVRVSKHFWLFDVFFFFRTLKQKRQ